MIALTQNNLRITISDASPNERRDWLMKSIAAAMRWKAMAGRTPEEDNEYVIVLSRLLDELIELEKHGE